MVQDCRTCADAIAKLKRWYSSAEKKFRILPAWQGMTLSNAMSAALSQYKTGVFRTFVAKLVSLQTQLDTSYQSDLLLQDRLLTATDVPAIQSTLRDRMPCTSQQAVNRISNKLSDKERLSGRSSACPTNSCPDREDDEDTGEVHYSLRKTFKGDARRQTDKSWMKPQRGGFQGGTGRPFRKR